MKTKIVSRCMQLVTTVLALFVMTAVILQAQPVSASRDLSGSGVALPSGYIFPFAGNWVYSQIPHTYQGIDLRQPTRIGCTTSTTYDPNSWIVAPKGGVVIKSTTAQVQIDHGDGFVTEYVHIATKDRIAAGAVVTRGQKIGHPSCETRWSPKPTGVHLHLNIIKKGTGYVSMVGSNFSGWTLRSNNTFVSQDGKVVVYPVVTTLGGIKTVTQFDRRKDVVSNSAPYSPKLTRPASGSIVSPTSPVQICWKNKDAYITTSNFSNINQMNDPNGDKVSFYAEIYGGSQSLNSGWRSASGKEVCWSYTPNALTDWLYSYRSNASGTYACRYEFKWHIKAKDQYGRGSSWSPDYFFVVDRCRTLSGAMAIPADTATPTIPSIPTPTHTPAESPVPTESATVTITPSYPVGATETAVPLTTDTMDVTPTFIE